MTALTRKLLRDLWKIRSQAVAIGLVIASGVALFVMMQGNWLLPIVGSLLVVGLLIILSSSAAAPFIYTLF